MQQCAWLAPLRAPLFAVLAMAALLLPLPAAVHAQDSDEGEVRALLERMQRALHELDYSGTIVYGERGRMETLRLWHANIEGRERERLVSATGEAREIVREDGRVVCIGADATSRSYEPGIAPALPTVAAQPFAGALPHYALLRAGDARIAGRSAEVVEIRARDAFRYSYRLWLDRETALLLKSLRFAHDGGTVDQLMFTDIQIGRQPSDEDLSPSETALAVDPAPPAGRMVAPAQAGWVVRDVPPGFVLTAVRQDEDGSGEHQVYSDGLASVSVYIEPLRGQRELAGIGAHGAINAYARSVDGHSVYVLGDVPDRTAQRFAHGIVRRADD